MNTLIVYESAWGNTKAVAEAVATGFSSDDPPQVVSVETAPPLQEWRSTCWWSALPPTPSG